MGSVVGSTQQIQSEQKLFIARQRNKNLLIAQITNDRMKKCIEQVLQKDIELQQILKEKINQQEGFTLALNGSYRGQRENEFIQSGYGELISDKQDRYFLGQWKNNLLEGKGCTIYVNDQEYQYYYGQHSKGVAHGKGAIVFNDEAQYQGDWENGQMTGEGSIYITNSLYYKGQVKDGKMHGQGKLILFSNSMNSKQSIGTDVAIIQDGGTIIEGQFYEDQMIEGTVKSQKGNYKGQMKDGKMDGKGTFISNDETFYDGQFKNNKRHGVGKSQNQGKVQIAQWENDKLVRVLEIQ
ncbi:unnamed protein product [Paramecium primaurelia]|uniref:MORN repeat protein n=1 Tax=Paramecium primaurelia TaxID=5886 RepID=A0A8S1JVD4_PARPR|nr:unnamed protein product [Paramecium primaurelia]